MLKLSKKWSYAIKAMIFIAKSDSLVHVIDIVKSEMISESLLRRIISELEKWWLVKTTKWRKWGVELWKIASNISIYNILETTWEELWISNCTKWLSCDNQHDCSTTNLLGNLQKWMNALLKMYTLDKMIK